LPPKNRNVKPTPLDEYEVWFLILTVFEEG
jgi:hypothetical protein